MSIQSIPKFEPSSGWAGPAPSPVAQATVMDAAALDRFCHPLSPADLESLRHQIESQNQQMPGPSAMAQRFQDLELAVEFLRLYREQHLPHPGAMPSDQEIASLHAQTRFVTDCLADLVDAFKAQGLHPVHLLVALRQLRLDSARWAPLSTEPSGGLP